MLGRKKIVACIAALTLLAVTLTACGKVGNSSKSDNGTETNENNSNEGTNDTSDTVGDISAFACNLFKKSYEVGSSKNVLVSPASVTYALGMVANGANNNTLVEFENSLNNGKNINSLNNTLHDMLEESKNSNELAIANAIWINKQDIGTVHKKFTDTVKDKYSSDINVKEFGVGLKDEINSWVGSKTNNKIKDLLTEEIDSNDTMALINCISFNGEWQKEFGASDIRENVDFTNLDNSISKVTMLSGVDDSTTHYVSHNGSDGIYKEYKGGNYGFIALLPPNGESMDDFITKMDTNYFSNIKSSVNKDMELWYSIPEFKTEFELNLKSLLPSLGIADAVDEQKADFTNMVDANSGYNVSIGKAIHKTYIDFNRKGTEAEAATAVVMQKSGMVVKEKEFKRVEFNKPFVYTIIDISSGYPIFIGVVNNCK